MRSEKAELDRILNGSVDMLTRRTEAGANGSLSGFSTSAVTSHTTT
jgi:hypothetical protein